MSTAFNKLSLQTGNTYPSPESTQERVLRKIKKLGLDALVDMIALNAIAVFFPGKDFVEIGKLVLRCYCIKAPLELLIDEEKWVSTKNKINFNALLKSLVGSIATFDLDAIYSLLITGTIHESGHFIFAKILYRGDSHIKIDPFALKGITWYNNKETTWLGSHLGKKGSTALLTAAGPAFQLAAIVALWFAAYCKKSFSGNRENRIANVSFAAAFNYPLTALNSDSSINDYVTLRQTCNLHPLVAAGSILAIAGLALKSIYRKEINQFFFPTKTTT